MPTRRQALALLALTACGPGQNSQSPPFTDPPATGPLLEITEFDASGNALQPAKVPGIQLDSQQWRARLTPLGFAVLRTSDTEMAFTGKYGNHHETGIYRCAGCGTALFSSKDKFESGTGWPSFTAPIATTNVLTAEDGSRQEVRCHRCYGHLGHVFPDGPPPTGLRYCINSAALRFVQTNS